MAYTQTEMEARDEGAEAFADGKARDTNPYSMLSQKNLWTCWDDGWEEAETESEDDGEDEDEG